MAAVGIKHRCGRCGKKGHKSPSCGRPKLKPRPKYEKVPVRKTNRPSKAGPILATYLSSDGVTIYTVRQGRDGVIYCNCLGWRMARKRNGEKKSGPRTCKHLKEYYGI